MAYVKIVPVATRQHLFNLLNYSQNEDKTLDKKLVDCFDCQMETAYNDFMGLHDGNRRGHLLAHHIIQSFRPGETTPEEAHRLGIELVQKMLPGYQFTISTHVDREHIHNHIIFNAVSYLTGNRYHGNKSTLQMMQNASDQICRDHGLSVIHKSGYQGLDRSTYELARKGRSWKVKLANDLDELLGNAPPADMAAFAQELRDKGYFVKVTERHITVTKIGEKKGIRLDTLAKQFGMQYTKANISHWIAGEPLEMDPPTPQDLTGNVQSSEWQRLEGLLVPNIAAGGQPVYSQISEKTREAISAKRAVSRSRALRTTISNAALYGLLVSDPKVQLEYENYRKWLDTRSLDRVKVIARPKISNELRQFGNITAARLYSVPGETVSMKVTPEQATAFRGMGIFYAGRITASGDVRVIFKAANTATVAKALNLPEHLMKSREEIRDEQRKRTELQTYMAEDPNTQKISWHCTAADLTRLDQASIPFDYTRQRTGYRVGIMEKDIERVCEVLEVPEEEIRRAVTAYDNRTDYRALKKAAQQNGERVAYRVVSPALFEVLRLAGVLCVAYDTRDGQKNVAMLESDIPVYEKVCQHGEKSNLQVYEQIKREASDRGEKPVYRVVSPTQLEQYLAWGITCAYFPKGENVNVAMTREEWDRLQDLLEQQHANRTQRAQEEQGRKRKHSH